MPADAIADGYDTGAVTSVRAADVEGAADFATVSSELLPAEQARIVQLLRGRVDNIPFQSDGHAREGSGPLIRPRWGSAQGCLFRK
jgi:hypothetical protein